MLGGFWRAWDRLGLAPGVYRSNLKDFGANSICKASDAERVKILVGSVLGGMGFDLILIGREMDD